MRFAKTFNNWVINGHEHLNLFYIETHGNNIEEFLDNAIISLETWHGSEGPAWELGDLPCNDYVAVEEIFKNYIKSKQK